MDNVKTTNEKVVGQPQTIIIKERRRANICGIIGFIFTVLGFFFYPIPVFGLIFCLLALIFSFIGLFKAPRGFAIAGFSLALVELIWQFILYGAIIYALFNNK